MLKPGKRQLKDITDQELRVIVEMSGHYGHKDYWGNFTITDIDRNMFKNSIVIDYEQTRISDGEKSLTVMFFEYAVREHYGASEDAAVAAQSGLRPAEYADGETRGRASVAVV